MNADLTNKLILLGVVGLSLTLVGGINIFLRSQSSWKRLCATFGSLLAVNGLALATMPENTALLKLTGMIFGGTSVLFTLLLPQVRTAIVKVATHSVFVWGLVTLGGIGTGAYALNSLDDQAEKELLDGDELLTFSGKPELTKVTNDYAWTDSGKTINLLTGEFQQEMNRGEAEFQSLQSLGVLQKVIRRKAADEHSNCHGWVFTGGRYWIDGQTVDLLLKENGYRAVNQPLPGDVVVYRDTNGQVSHTAIVRSGGIGAPPIVEGKWGWMGVFLHLVDESPYGKSYTFYRSKRKGHLVVGMGGKDPSPALPPLSDIDHHTSRRY